MSIQSKITPGITFFRLPPKSKETGHHELPASSTLDWRARCMRLDEQRKLETAGRIMASSRNVNEVLAKIAQQAFYLSIVDREKGFTSIWLFGESNLREKAPILPGQLVTTGRHVTTYPLDKEPEAISKVKSL